MARDPQFVSTRRTIIAVVASSFVLTPLALKAQQVGQVRRIGTLSMGDAPPPAELAFNEGHLPDFGWVPGKNLVFERRFAGSTPELLDELATELVRLKVDAIVTSGTDASLAAKRATSMIPIVMFSVGDPVLVGLVRSLSRPGGNITGFCIVSTELDAKRLELLPELVPG